MFSDEVSQEEKEYIEVAIDFLKGYGCSGEYNRVLVDKEDFLPEVIYYFKNPGWSIIRGNDIFKELYSLLEEYSQDNDLVDLFRDIYITYE